MKQFITTISILVLLVGCTTNPYVLTGNDKFFLIKQIKEAERKGYITDRPIIVLDGVPYRFSIELKDRSLNISKSDIKSIEILKTEKAVQIYGDWGKAGVMLVTTKSKKNNSSGNILPDNQLSKDNKILYLKGDKKISKEELTTMDPDSIESINVINKKEILMKYTSEDYDTVVVIIMKKRVL